MNRRKKTPENLLRGVFFFFFFLLASSQLFRPAQGARDRIITLEENIKTKSNDYKHKNTHNDYLRD